MSAGVGYVRKKKMVCREERKTGRRRERVVVVAWWLVGGYVGFLWWSRWQTRWWLCGSTSGTTEREREGKQIWHKLGQGAGFLADFRPVYLHAQAMKFTSNYRERKREVLSLMMQNLGH